jgi:translation initiation factor IF-2
MAKKRVHEIAKEQGLTSKEVLASLQAAGIEVKSASSSLDEAEALKALGGANGGQAAAEPAATGDGAQSAPSGSTDGPARPAARQRPMREAAPGTRPSAGKRRRVVIDSQASRREMGPPPPMRPPRRRGGRRRRPLLEEPVDKGPIVEVELPPTKVNSGATVREVAESLGLSSADVIKKLMELGEMATLTQTLSDEAIEVLAGGFDQKVEIVRAADDVEPEPEIEEDEGALQVRPPVVTVMGHVDHGKTSLLDAVRETEVAAGEAGGITQHIGAYQVHHGGKPITFVDTPGHEAFTAMRARGAKVTDIAVVVVAADDGVMPQSLEAVDHARAAEVPILIAVNKIDKEGAQPERVRNELAGHGLTPEDWGGDTIYCDVSAKTKEGLDNLLDMVLLVAEVEELRANPDADASGVVVEAQLDPGRGPVVRVIVQRGTLSVGDAVVAGSHWGRIRAMVTPAGERAETAAPGEPVELLGFDGVVEAGEPFRVVENERRARQLAGERANRLKTEALARRQARKISLEDVFAKAQQGELKEINIILKSDVSGSLEALQDEIAKIPQGEIAVNIIRAAPGGINESDVMLASASDAIIIGFNVRPLTDARQAAEREGIDIRTYSVIYKVTDELRAAMEGMLEPEEVEETVGQAEVLQTFKASRVGTIAGCMVTEGKVTRASKARLLREGTIVWTGEIGSLRRFKDDVREVPEGQECGIVLAGFQDVKEGDVLEIFETKQVEKTLE